jgi:RNA polymerase sigma-70 factor (ECF subfamily)
MATITENDQNIQEARAFEPIGLARIKGLVQQFAVCWEAHPEQAVVTVLDPKGQAPRAKVELRKIGFSLERTQHPNCQQRPPRQTTCEKEPRRNKMRSNVVYEINELGTGTVSFSDPTAAEALVAAAKRGDERAFETLVTRYQPKIFAVAKRYTRIREDAEDIVQQTFLKAFVHLHRFEGKASFCTWLTRIAINEALMLLRRGPLRHVALDDLSEDETATHGLELPDSRPDPEANYLKREETELLSAAIAMLTARLRVAIELRELAEFSTRETAQRMGVSVAAVKARIFHGRSKLRKTLRHPGITTRGAQPLSVARLANLSCSSVR